MNELEVGCSCGLKVMDDGGTERGVEVYMQASGKEFPWCLILRLPAPQPQNLPWLALINATCRVCFTAIKD
jgi:hypothetical protein